MRGFQIKNKELAVCPCCGAGLGELENCGWQSSLFE